MISDKSHDRPTVPDPVKRGALRPAFTLTELLVVIGIIALLIAITFPILSKARHQANTVRCAARLHQIGESISMYVNENHGTLPLGYNSRITVRVHYWFQELVPYIKQGGLPENATRDDYARVYCDCLEWDSPMFPKSVGDIGYSYNAEPELPAVTYGMWLETRLFFPGRYFKIWQIRDRCDRAEVADGDDSNGVVRKDTDDPHYTPFPNANYDGISLARHGAKDWYQSGGCNVLFFDGHVATLSPAQAMHAFVDPEYRLPEKWVIPQR